MEEGDLGRLRPRAGHYKVTPCSRAHLGGLLGRDAEAASELEQEREGGKKSLPFVREYKGCPLEECYT